VALTPLFGGALLFLWLTLGTIGWLIASVRRPARTNFLAWGAALLAALIGGPLPALLGWRTLPALLVGLLLALVAATAVALRLTR
jgi:hypothetical protein